MSWLRKLERLLFILGVVMLTLYGAARIHQMVLSKAKLQRFKAQLASADEIHQVALSGSAPDFGLWSQRRIKGYQESLAVRFAPAIAILRIPKVQVEGPVSTWQGSALAQLRVPPRLRPSIVGYRPTLPARRFVVQIGAPGGESAIEGLANL